LRPVKSRFRRLLSPDTQKERLIDSLRHGDSRKIKKGKMSYVTAQSSDSAKNNLKKNNTKFVHQVSLRAIQAHHDT